MSLSPLEQGREAFRRQAWGEAYLLLSAADRDAPLGGEDLIQLAIGADLVGHDTETVDFWTRAHHEFVRRGQTEQAARCAFWLALFALLVEGDVARSSGWLARGRRLLDEDPHDCVEQGYLLLPAALRCLFVEGDSAAAAAIFDQAASIGRRFGDRDLTSLSRLGLGQAWLRMGQTVEGIALLDEVMAIVTAGELSTLAVGIVYCAVLSSCQEIFDLRRAQEWTASFSRWCESQPEVVQFRGQCLVHRAAIMQLQGEWPSALEEAQRACERLSMPGSRPWAGGAFYQQGELHRLRGEFAKAEQTYRQASEWGRIPQPGLALLWLAQGRPDAAVAAISRALAETRASVLRCTLLPAHVEIMLAANEIKVARASADELAVVIAAVDAPLLRALSAQSTGAVMLAEGDPLAALGELRKAWTVWYELEAPYEAARVRVLIALACRILDDEGSAELELDAARQIFQRLGATPDLTRVSALMGLAAGPGPAGLTEREVEVLRLVASGKTNHTIAGDLFISDHTVRRHLQNIFAKLGVSTRAAATAFAFQHNLV